MQASNGNRLRAQLALAAPLAFILALPLAAAELPASGEQLELPAGSVLRPVASAVAPPLVTLPAAAGVEVLERDGRWLRVRWGETTGWVDAEAPAAPAATAAPPPTLTTQRALAAARELLGDDARSRLVGPFVLLTDVADGPLLDALDELAAQVADLYAARYGLAAGPGGDASQPASAPARRDDGSVVLFADAAAYRAFCGRLAAELGADLGGAGEAIEGDLAGHTRGHLAALHAAGRSREQVSRLLVHELVHLLNRRRLGGTPATGGGAAPPLPPWLDEGLAGDFDLFASTAGGRLDPGALNRRTVVVHGRARPYGPLIALPLLARDAERGRLEGLAALAARDRAGFLEAAGRAERYALAAFWVRYLVDGEQRELAAPFHAWLRAVAAGGSADPDALAARLEAASGRDAERLDAAFRRWLVDLAYRLRLPPAAR